MPFRRAESYNQRAFIHFPRQDFEPALADLERNPEHIAARAGLALTLIHMGTRGPGGRLYARRWR